MKVSLKTAFSILDGRLSTGIGEVYEMLNFIFDENFMTHQLPAAMKALKEENPTWFNDSLFILDGIKKKHHTTSFPVLMALIENEYSNVEIELGKCSRKIEFLAGLV